MVSEIDQFVIMPIFFNVSLTVHLSIILVTDQLNAQIHVSSTVVLIIRGTYYKTRICALIWLITKIDIRHS